MNRITLHIEYLLRYHDCVIAPGLGAFIVSTRSASINEAWGLIMPPSRQVCFNSAIVNNDGLLASSISRRESISYESAQRLMYADIDVMHDILKTEGELRIGNIGILRHSVEGNISFQPLYRPEQLSAQHGLGAIALPRPTQEKMPESTTGVTRQSEYYHIRLSKKAVKIAASIVVVLLAGVSFIIGGINSGENTANIDMASMLPMKGIMSTSTTESTMTDATTENAVAETTIPTSYIVVGVFSTIEQAELFISQHEECGYETEIIPYSNKYCVAIGLNRDNLELKSILNVPTFRKEFPGAWIWSK